MLNEFDKSVNLITINEDCRESIFQHLEWKDLICVADTNKQLYTSVCRVFKRKYGKNDSRIDFGLPFNDIFLECKQSEPVICVSHPLFAVKMLRIFGHLIVNLSVDYHLFYLGDTKPMNMMEDYLAEYCSQTLYQLSIQNSTLIHEALEDMQKPLTGVKTLQIQYCTFGKNFTFNKVFPNLQTLKSGSNSYLYSSVIIAHHPTLKHLTIRFDDQIQEDNIIKLFQLNPQLGNSKICFFRDSIGFDSFPRLKQCFPSLQKINRYYYNPLHIHTFFCYGNIYERRDRYKYPNNLSNGYKNELENLYVFCSKNIYGQKVEKKIFR